MIYPMFALVAWTNVLIVLIARTRVRSVQSGEVPASYYSLMSGHDVPEFIAKSTRHFSNLFEVPVLFYVAGVLYIAMDMTHSAPIVLAWAFVAARLVHSIIHLSYNNVLHRLAVFGIANICVLALWISIVMEAGR